TPGAATPAAVVPSSPSAPQSQAASSAPAPGNPSATGATTPGGAPIIVATAPTPSSTGSAEAATHADSVKDKDNGSSVIVPARAGYQNAWSQREAGHYDEAVATIDATLIPVAKALDGDLDAASRRDLVEIRAKLEGLRAAAHHELEAGSEP